MESGTLKISGVLDDGIQVELSSDAVTGVTSGHDEENSGNFYMEDGTLTISDYGGKAIKADGTITYSGGTQNFSTSDTEIHAGIQSISDAARQTWYDLNGHVVNQPSRRGFYIVRQGGKVVKMVIR